MIKMDLRLFYFPVTIYAWIYNSSKKTKITDPKSFANQNHLSDRGGLSKYTNDNFRFNWTS